MKNPSDSLPFIMLIIVMGLPGSGKSYFAQRLAERLEATYLGSDSVRKSMNALGRYTQDDKLLVYNQLYTLADEALKKNEPVVVDATFYLEQLREQFVTLAKTHETAVCLILIAAPEALIKERLARKRQDSEADYAVYQQVKQQFETSKGPYLQLLSGRKNIHQMLAKAITYINNLK